MTDFLSFLFSLLFLFSFSLFFFSLLFLSLLLHTFFYASPFQLRISANGSNIWDLPVQTDPKVPNWLNWCSRTLVRLLAGKAFRTRRSDMLVDFKIFLRCGRDAAARISEQQVAPRATWHGIMCASVSLLSHTCTWVWTTPLNCVTTDTQHVSFKMWPRAATALSRQSPSYRPNEQVYL